jgi:hypothetical protein
MILGGRDEVETDPDVPPEPGPATPVLPKPRSGSPTE